MDLAERKKELEEKLAELMSRWPAHSVPPAMAIEREELEEELEKIDKQMQSGR